MSDYAIVAVGEIADVFGGKYAGAMRMLHNEQIAFTYREMPPGAGGRGSYGHRHKRQEEIYYVISGRLTFKLGDDVVEVADHTVVRVAPGTVRSVHNDSDADAELIIVSIRIDDVDGDAELVPDFWPD
jgi:mannose-6-phosphate isomerase-like protein (cupin superfamily)